MKKNILIVIIIIAIACIAGGVIYTNMSKPKDKTASNTTDESMMPESIVDDSDESKSTGDGKILVVYYSAQNHTKAVAEKVAKNLNADIFEIEPEKKYTDDDLDWTNDNSRVSKEHDDESLRDVKLKNTNVENWDDYDTILIGYPIWWGIAAWPTDSFVKANDFTGKTVYTFCTSVSSGLGSSTSLLKKEAKGGDWHDGQRFSSNATDKEIKKWTDSLNI